MTQEETIKKALQEFPLPCRYDVGSQMIFASNGQMMVDVRGWGHLSSKFKDGKLAMKLQDTFGQFVVDAINNYQLLEAELAAVLDRDTVKQTEK